MRGLRTSQIDWRADSISSGVRLILVMRLAANALAMSVLRLLRVVLRDRVRLHPA